MINTHSVKFFTFWDELFLILWCIPSYISIIAALWLWSEYLFKLIKNKKNDNN